MQARGILVYGNYPNGIASIISVFTEGAVRQITIFRYLWRLVPKQQTILERIA
jgi:hypothetical protein